MALERLPLLHDISFEEGLGWQVGLIPDLEEKAQFAVSPRFGMAAPAEYSSAVVSLLIQRLAFESKALFLLFLQLLDSVSQISARLHIVAITLSPRLLPAPSAQRA